MDYYTFQKANNKGADHAAQLSRLVCTFAVHLHLSRYFSPHCSFDNSKLGFIESVHESYCKTLIIGQYFYLALLAVKQQSPKYVTAKYWC